VAPERHDFEEFVRGQRERMLRLCAGILSDPVQAEDAAQEVFVKAYRAWESFRGDSSRATWLYRIAVRHCVDLLRYQQRLRRLFSTGGEQESEDPVDSAPEAEGHLPGFETSVESRIAAKEILSALSEGDRIVLSLREIEGLSYEEMARVLEISVEAVRSRLARARRALTRVWEKRLEEGS
jgi:RNA polymerase sigma-70 factor (ECF subfamily)